MFPLIVVLAGVAGGTLLLGLIGTPSEPRLFRLAAGAGLGFPVLGLVAFVFASWWGLTLPVVLVSALLTAGVPAFAAFQRARREKGRTRRVASGLTWPLAAYLAVFLVFFAFFFAQAAYEKDGGLATGE